MLLAALACWTPGFNECSHLEKYRLEFQGGMNLILKFIFRCAGTSN